MAVHDFLTKEEVVNSYEWKLTEKILKRQFPWIKGIELDEGDVNKYNLIFVDIIIDPYLLAKEKDWMINWYKVRGLRNREPMRENFLTIYYNVSYDETKELYEEIEDTLYSVKSSKAIPDDLKLPKSRSMGIGGYKTSSDYQIPEDAENYELEYKKT